MTLLSVSAVSHQYYRANFAGGQQAVSVLHDISFSLQAGETVALLGRSGCGKSTLARLIMGLESPVSGNISWRGAPITDQKGAARLALLRDIQMVFQDPIGAVNPRKTVRHIIAEPLRHLLTLSRAEQSTHIKNMLHAVELDDPALLDKRPMQLSGGQLQRVCLARALVVEPRLLILDEAVSNLDLVLQAGIIALLQRLQQQFNTACLFITHDLRLVERFCQRVMVMDQGQLVETLPVRAPLSFTSAAGQALQKAVLPPWPQRAGLTASAQ